MKPLALVISCEHAVNAIPKAYTKHFEPFQDLLATHAAIDLGAKEIAYHFKNNLSCDFLEAKATRLLIDCNRSLSHPTCFSKITKPLSPTVKQGIIDQYYSPYREELTNLIQKKVDLNYQVLHLSIHSFTPILHGIKRMTDISFLYDPRRLEESLFAKRWQASFQDLTQNLRIRRNYPYKGTSDGFTTALRKQFQGMDYIGLEVETNQALVTKQETRVSIEKLLVLSLQKTIQAHYIF